MLIPVEQFIKQIANKVCMKTSSNMRKKSKASSTKPAETALPQELNCYEGERLADLLKSIGREIECEKLTNNVLPEKIWLKQQFSIGVNDVTRVLERMSPYAEGKVRIAGHQPLVSHSRRREVPPVQLQAILLASDCNPRLLTKHIPILASSRKVPLIYVKDKKGGSLRLGELVKLKTAIAIGIKSKGSSINGAIEETFCGTKNHLRMNKYSKSESSLVISVQ